jgi:hypothetical protein
MANGFKIEYSEPGMDSKEFTIDEIVSLLEKPNNNAENANSILKELLGE